MIQHQRLPEADYFVGVFIFIGAVPDGEGQKKMAALFEMDVLPAGGDQVADEHHPPLAVLPRPLTLQLLILSGLHGERTEPRGV